MIISNLKDETLKFQDEVHFLLLCYDLVWAFMKNYFCLLSGGYSV